MNQITQGKTLDRAISTLKSRVGNSKDNIDRIAMGTALNSVVIIYKNETGKETLEDYLLNIHRQNLDKLTLPKRLLVYSYLGQIRLKLRSDYGEGKIDVIELKSKEELYRQASAYFKQNYIVSYGNKKN